MTDEGKLMPALPLHLHLLGLFRRLQGDQTVAGFDQIYKQPLRGYRALRCRVVAVGETLGNLKESCA